MNFNVWDARQKDTKAAILQSVTGTHLVEPCRNLFVTFSQINIADRFSMSVLLPTKIFTHFLQVQIEIHKVLTLS